MEVPPIGLILTEDQVSRNLKKAVRFYAGYATIKAADLADDQIHSNIDASPDVDGAQDVELSQSEFAIIEPLFKLYVELENSTALEASRGLGIDPYARATGEIQGDIRQYETDMPSNAFSEEIVTI